MNRRKTEEKNGDFMSGLVEFKVPVRCPSRDL